MERVVVPSALPWWRQSADEVRYNTRVKQYGDVLRVSVWNVPIYNPDGWEPEGWEPKAPPERGPVPEERSDNIRRARQKVYDIAFANRWDWFCTMTLAPEKCDRYDATALGRMLRGWLSNRVQRHGLRYLLVPERHKDGALHVHMLAAGQLALVDSGTVLVAERAKPVKRETARRAGYNLQKAVHNMPDWPLGWSTALPVDGPQEAVAAYLAKYLTKDQEKIFGKRYLAGGDIAREVPTFYTRSVFDDAEGAAYDVAPGRKVKYFSLDAKGSSLCEF